MIILTVVTVALAVVMLNSVGVPVPDTVLGAAEALTAVLLIFLLVAIVAWGTGASLHDVRCAR